MESIGDPREGPSTERVFEVKTIPPWPEQVTARAVAVSLALGVALSGVMMNLVFTSGIIPSLNIFAALLGFFLLKAWTGLLGQIGVPHRPFTRQENAVVQTCVVACASMTYSGTRSGTSSGSGVSSRVLVNIAGGDAPRRVLSFVRCV
jgi:hypothetical protein